MCGWWSLSWKPAYHFIFERLMLWATAISVTFRLIKFRHAFALLYPSRSASSRRRLMMCVKTVPPLLLTSSAASFKSILSSVCENKPCEPSFSTPGLSAIYETNLSSRLTSLRSVTALIKFVVLDFEGSSEYVLYSSYSQL